MIDKFLYEHPLEHQAYTDMVETVAFDEEVMFYYKNYIEKMRVPDLLGKTVKITEYQFPEVYQIISNISSIYSMEAPDAYVYEDFYYGVDSKGSDKAWIEISAKTLEDFSKDELMFLLAREICSIYLQHTQNYTMINETLGILSNGISFVGKDTLTKSWKAMMYRWGRTANYTADCFGYIACSNLTAAISAIKKQILNSRFLSDQMNLVQFMKQSEAINLLDDDISQFTKLDELVPYGPFRIKYLIGYASSSRAIKAMKLIKEGETKCSF